MDIFHLDRRRENHSWLLQILEIHHLDNTQSRTVVSKLKAQFAEHGIPDIFVSDIGPHYISDQFKNFTKKRKIQHLTSLPGYPQSNRQAEAAGNYAKNILKKVKEVGNDPYLAILGLLNDSKLAQYRD